MHVHANRHRLRATAAAGARVASSAAAALAGGEDARGAGAGEPQRFTLVMKGGAQKLVDNPPRGGRPSLGDTVSFNKTLHDTSGSRVGRVEAHGIITTSGRNPSETLSGMIVLAGGRLAVQETFKFSDKVHRIAITGGTGRFAGATGEIVAGQSGRADRLEFTVHLP